MHMEDTKHHKSLYGASCGILFFGPGCIQSTMNLTRSTANMEFTFPLFPSLAVMLFIDIECVMKSVLRVSLKFYLLHLIYSRHEDG